MCILQVLTSINEVTSRLLQARIRFFPQNICSIVVYLKVMGPCQAEEVQKQAKFGNCVSHGGQEMISV